MKSITQVPWPDHNWGPGCTSHQDANHTSSQEGKALQTVLLPPPPTPHPWWDLIPDFVIILSRLQSLTLRSSKPSSYLLQTGRTPLTSVKLGQSKVYDLNWWGFWRTPVLLALHILLSNNTIHELKTLYLGVNLVFPQCPNMLESCSRVWLLCWFENLK